ncbi:alpha/beta hydrolase [Algoriphagus marincola]|uniref:Alpha/beta hydrolase n=1 Tax=Algoriphagus marincola TaxID=264027 RepID=A0ABS7N3Z7_9BACT|nr:alpha/beta hydrolase [Algoriphagus marincola]MBY5950648.1 alpha/beta hydrolase [Algoriphagus marincola]
MKKYFIISLILTFSINALSQQSISIEKTDCYLDNCDQYENLPNIEFGYLNVPEDYDNLDGRWIKVAFSLVKSTSDNPEPDPVLIFAGGWGQPELHQTLWYSNILPVENRDIILYDYRGSGHSKPSLCADLGEKHLELIKQDLDFNVFNQKLNQQFYSCFDELKQQDIDYRLYGTATKTKDALKLIEQLGYTTVNLFGASNGTMGIQGFLRAAEGSSIEIRSIFSDSNVPMRDYQQGDLSVLYKEVLEKILDDCSQDPSCNAAYPNLKERFHSFLIKTISNPPIYNGESETVFNTYLINSFVHQLLYNATLHKDIPLLLEAFMVNELGFIDSIYPVLEELLLRSNGTSVINYTYDWKARQAKVSKEYEETKKNIPEYMWADFWLDFYTKDTTITYNPRDTIPVTSDAPALIVAGTYDPITAPEYSRIMHDRYSNSYYFEFPKVGHGVFITPCGQKMLKEFLEQPDKQPNDECIQSLASTPIPFTTSIYANSKVSSLIKKVAVDRNLLWIVILFVPFLLALIYIFREVLRVIRKKTYSALRTALFLSIIFFLVGLGYYMLATVNLGGLTLFFGLVDEAWWLPWFSLVIIILGILQLYRMIKESKYTFWNFGAIMSAVLILITAFGYGIHLF